jgi:folate-dependent phosphoribosylglycinamide formyltransferase PurN
MNVSVSPDKSIRVIIISINDIIYLPKLFQPLFKDTKFDIASVILIPMTSAINMHPEGSLGVKAVVKRLRLYGTNAFMKLSLMHLKKSIRSLFFCNVTLKGLSESKKIRVIKWKHSINNPNMISMIQELKPDILIGVFSEKAGLDFLSSSPKGLMLLHYSLLPHYAGREPTFWTLLEDPQKAGITFFKACDRIDNGMFLVQAGTSISNASTLHEAISILTDLASKNIVKAAKLLFEQEESSQFIQKRITLKSWPNRQDVLRFYQKGLRFI